MEIECISCGWAGDETMLVSKTDDINDDQYIYCPECGDDDMEELEEYEDN